MGKTTDEKSLETAIMERVQRSGDGSVAMNLDSNESYTLHEPLHIGQEVIEFAPYGYAEEIIIVSVWHIKSIRIAKSVRQTS